MKYLRQIELEYILIMLIMIMIYYFSLFFINFLKITLNLCLYLFEKKSNWSSEKIKFLKFRFLCCLVLNRLNSEFSYQWQFDCNLDNYN